MVDPFAEDSDEPPDETGGISDAEAAFMTLSHELRLEILLALWEAPGFSLAFSELRRAVGERDSGSFTYHLSELVGHFVAETDEGYELQYPGHRVLDAIQSGVFHEEATVGPVDLEGGCRECGGGLTFTYDTDFVGRVTCPECGNRALEWPFDPGGTADRSPEEVVEAFDRRTRLVWACALDGVCPFCAGQVDRDLATGVSEEGSCVGVVEQLDRYDEFFASDHPAVIALDCRRCSFYSFVPVGVVLLSRPTVTAALQDAGVSVRDRRLWEFGFVVDAAAVSVRRTDPVRVELAIRDVEDCPRYVVDDQLDVAPEADT